MTHELKTWPEYFKEVKSGRKTFEVRKNDRDFCEGDILHLNEWEPKGYSDVNPNELVGRYTGEMVKVRVDYVMKVKSGDFTWFGIPRDTVVMSIQLLQKPTT